MNPSAKGALEEHKLSPRKSLGQNFLTNPEILTKLAAAAEISRADTVIEIGPGLGHLTRVLAERAGRVIAIELDHELASRLHMSLAAETGGVVPVEIVEADALKVDLPGLLPADAEGRYKVVANLPYYITSAVLRHILSARPRPERIVVTVQREVARRMSARPPQMSLLAVSVQLYAQVRIGGVIPAGAFYPRPKVDSAWVSLVVREGAPFGVEDEEAFFRVVRAGFGSPRQQLHNTLGRILGLPAGAARGLLERAGIDPVRRPQTLSIAEWAGLTKILLALPNPML